MELLDKLIDNSNLTTVLKLLLERTDKLERKLGVQQKVIDEQQQTIEELQGQLQQMRGAGGDHLSLASLNRSIQAMKPESLEKLGADVTSLLRRVDTIDNVKIPKLDQICETIQVSTTNSFAALDQQVQKLSKDLQNQVLQTASKFADTLTEIDHLRDEIDKFRKEMSESNERLMGLLAGAGKGGDGISGALLESIKNQISEMLSRLSSVEARVGALEATSATLSARMDTVEAAMKNSSRGSGLSLSDIEGFVSKAEFERLAAQFATFRALLDEFRKEMEANVARNIKGELRRFEKDLMAYLKEQNSQKGSGHNHSTDGSMGGTAIGRMHFRCLACDRVVGDSEQASSGVSNSSRFKEVAQIREPAGTPGPYIILANQSPQKSPGLQFQSISGSKMVVEKGVHTEVYGSDGGVYKGRGPSTTAFVNSNSQLLLQRRAQSYGGTSRPRTPGSLSGRSSPSPDRASSGQETSSGAPGAYSFVDSMASSQPISFQGEAAEPASLRPQSAPAKNTQRASSLRPKTAGVSSRSVSASEAISPAPPATTNHISFSDGKDASSPAASPW